MAAKEYTPEALVELQGDVRDTSKNPRQLRAAGFTPATVYAKGQESVSIQVDQHSFFHLLHKGARRFNVQPLGKELVVKQLQHDYVSLEVLHAEFMPAS